MAGAKSDAMQQPRVIMASERISSKRFAIFAPMLHILLAALLVGELGASGPGDLSVDHGDLLLHLNMRRAGRLVCN